MTRDEVEVEVVAGECRLAVRLPRAVVDELRGALAGVAGALAAVADGGAGEPGRLCRWARLDEAPGFPGVGELFKAFAEVIDRARGAVARAARRAGCSVDRLEAVRLAVEAVAAGAVEAGGWSVEWVADVELEGNGRGVARARVTLFYVLRGARRGVAVVELGGAGREGECLARGCAQRSLVRIARGPRGVMAFPGRGGLPWDCTVLCLASCKAVEEALEYIVRVSAATPPHLRAREAAAAP